MEKAKFPEQADGEYTVTAQVKDPAGNNSLVSEGAKPLPSIHKRRM
ncbi:hypothetical protein INT80_12475 [Gallibacterium anatis]|uniref:Bacterial Ig-like domain-containing protein n=1 Tax=Gallibacterium anatis TaxID=750 RepID=A0A930UWT8_9PAST|nr:hypothetical protein [Gallibacterium anatis]